MELPEIIEKITHKGEELKKEYFWALEIGDEGVKSAIWTVEEEKTKVIALGSSEIWENGVEELVQAVEKSFSRALEQFVEEGERPTKVIFGLPEDWAAEDKIDSQHQELLSELCRRLKLEPLGFVSVFDALNHHLKEVEGTPVSAILVSLNKKKIALAVLEVGEIKGREQVSRSENLVADVCEGLLRFPQIESFPSRILLFNSEDLEEARQLLIAYSWQSGQVGEKKLPFLHFPKIEILPNDFDIVAVALAGGKEVAKSLGFKVTAESETVKEEPAPAEVSATVPEEVIDLGFVKGKDVALETGVEEPTFAEVPENKEEVALQVEVKPSKLGKILELFKGILAKIRLPGLPHFSLRIPFVGIGVVIILAVLALGSVGIALWWKVARAEVVIYVTPQISVKEEEVTFDPNQEVLDWENLVLPTQMVETQSSGETTTATTGEKTVGEKSKGEVMVYNRTNTKKVFPEGTVLIGPGSLKFTLDRETTVASKSPDPTGKPADIWGESKTTITAVDIGAQYNLAVKSLFSIKDFSTDSFLAKNESALTGGTSRQIQAVAEKDQKDLTNKLSGELTEKAKGELLAKVPPGKKLIEEGLLATAVSTDFDYKVGEEAQVLGLKLTVKVSGPIFSQDDFSALAQKLLSGSVPQGYELKKEEITGRFELKKKNEDGSLIFKTFIEVNLLPKLDKEEILKNLKGKYPDLARQYLSSLNGYADSEIILSPKLPGILGTLPRRTEKILVEVRSK